MTLLSYIFAQIEKHSRGPPFFFVFKWQKVEEEFTNYFKEQWLSPGFKNCFVGAKHFADCTNSAVGSFNRRIEDDFNFRERVKINAFKMKIKIMDIERNTKITFHKVGYTHFSEMTLIRTITVQNHWIKTKLLVFQNVKFLFRKLTFTSRKPMNQ